MQGNRRIGAGLWIAAGVLAFAAFALWLWVTNDAEQRQGQADADAIFGGRQPEQVEPNRAPSIALGAVAGVLFVSGAVFLASPQTQESDASDRPSPSEDRS